MGGGGAGASGGGGGECGCRWGSKLVRNRHAAVMVVVATALGCRTESVHGGLVAGCISVGII